MGLYKGQTKNNHLHEKPFDKIFDIWLQSSRPVDFSTEYLFVDSKGIIVKEWRISGQHFIDEYPECPPVNGETVTFALDDLGCEILGGAAQGPGAVRDAFGETKVGDAEVTSLVQQKIFRLEKKNIFLCENIFTFICATSLGNLFLVNDFTYLQISVYYRQGVKIF